MRTNRSTNFIKLVEKILKPIKVDYKKDYHGPIQVYSRNHNSTYFKNFNVDQKRSAEENSIMDVHDALTKEAHEHFEKEAGEKSENAKGPTKDAAEKYTGSSYDEINKHLRLGDNIERSNVRHIANLKKLTKNKTKHSFTVYRGVTKNLVNPKEDEFFHDKGFTSTSLNQLLQQPFPTVTISNFSKFM